MPKLIAIINVIAWSGFWAFGYLAITTHAANAGQMVTATIIAFVALVIGVWAYFRLARLAETTGYARPKNRAPQIDQNEEV